MHTYHASIMLACQGNASYVKFPTSIPHVYCSISFNCQVLDHVNQFKYQLFSTYCKSVWSHLINKT